MRIPAHADHRGSAHSDHTQRHGQICDSRDCRDGNFLAALCKSQHLFDRTHIHFSRLSVATRFSACPPILHACLLQEGNRQQHDSHLGCHHEVSSLIQSNRFIEFVQILLPATQPTTINIGSVTRQSKANRDDAQEAQAAVTRSKIRGSVGRFACSVGSKVGCLGGIFRPPLLLIPAIRAAIALKPSSFLAANLSLPQRALQSHLVCQSQRLVST